MDPEMLDFARLDRLRRCFLERGPSGVADYWSTEEDLAAYDAVLGARIGWKWDAVLDEIEARELLRPSGPVLDWGCGSGVASSRFLSRFPATRLFLHDRSAVALHYATRRLSREHPELDIGRLDGFPGLEPEVLLVSHVLNELDEEGEAELVRRAQRSHHVIWVEAGDHDTSRRLSRVRDRLREHHRVLAPCPHQGRCGALAEERDWCHLFARPPRRIFQDAAWARIGRALRIDLRALPYAFLVLQRRDVEPLHALREDQGRVVGRPDVATKEARLFLCDADGLHRVRAIKNHDRAFFRALKKEPDRPLIGRFRREGDRVRPDDGPVR